MIRRSPRGITGQSGDGIGRLGEIIEPSEISAIASQYRDAIRKMAEADVYWCQERHCVTFRRASARHVFKLPPQTVWVGRYAYPFSAPAFLQDLEDVLARIQVSTLTKLPV